MLNTSDSDNEFPTIPDIQAMMMPQLLDSPQTHISLKNSRQYQQLEAETHTKMFRNAKAK